MRLLLVIGLFRPGGTPDSGALLLTRLARSRHRIGGLVLCPGDPLWSLAGSLGVPALPLLPELAQPRLWLRRALHRGGLRERVRDWTTPLRDPEPDLGVCFYGNWLPPDLYGLPRHGFLNFHPGPLPELRGMEPETFAVLEGRASTHGSVHRVAEDYDAGPILTRTAPVPLTRCTPPAPLARALARRGVGAMVRAVDALERGAAQSEPQDAGRATKATRSLALAASRLDPVQDDARRAGRRLRAFWGQEGGICLKVSLEGEQHQVLDLETWTGVYPGVPGDLLGRYRGDGPFAGGPILRIADGVAVLRLGARLAVDPVTGQVPEPLGHYPPPPHCPRRRGTRRPALLTSLQIHR
jgi:methionyl-tRNA formyltransferase